MVHLPHLFAVVLATTTGFASAQSVTPTTTDVPTSTTTTSPSPTSQVLMQQIGNEMYGLLCKFAGSLSPISADGSKCPQRQAVVPIPRLVSARRRRRTIHLEGRAEDVAAPPLGISTLDGITLDEAVRRIVASPASTTIWFLSNESISIYDKPVKQGKHRGQSCIGFSCAGPVATGGCLLLVHYAAFSYYEVCAANANAMGGCLDNVGPDIVTGLVQYQTNINSGLPYGTDGTREYTDIVQSMQFLVAHEDEPGFFTGAASSD